MRRTFTLLLLLSSLQLLGQEREPLWPKNKMPDAPMALMDQGWVIDVSEIESCSKSGIAGFIIKLTSGK